MNKFQSFVARKVFGLDTRAWDLFGSIGKNTIPLTAGRDFIPKDDQGNVIYQNPDRLEGRAVWLGLESKQMQFFAYRYCAPLAGVIERLATADANGVVEFRDEDNNTIKNINKIPKLSRIRKLLKKPNPYQTRMEFRAEQRVLSKIFGYCPVWCIGGVSSDRTYTKYMFNLNPCIVEPVLNEHFSMFGNKTNIVFNTDGTVTEKTDGVERTAKIKEWKFTIGSISYTIPNEDVMLVKDGLIEDPRTGLPISKVAGLDFNVSNINAAMEADNVLLKKKGPLGIFSGDSKPDIAGMTPMPPAEQDDLQLQLSKYGLTTETLQHIIARWPIKWHPISFNARDLMTKETARMGIDSICDRMDYPAELMSGKNATYENRNSSEKFLYNNNIIPTSLRTDETYNSWFGLEEYSIIHDFNHLPILQEDILHAGEASKAEAEALLIEWEAGQITWNQWQLERGRDAVAGMDIYYPEYIKGNPVMDKNKVKNTDNGKNN